MPHKRVTRAAKREQERKEDVWQKKIATRDFITHHSKRYPYRRHYFFQLGPRQIVSESRHITTKEFKVKINQSLALLKEKAPRYYGLICLFNNKLRVTDEFPNTGAVANLRKNTLDFNGANFSNYDVVDIAQTLVHEVMHFWQYHLANPLFYKIDKNTNQWICFSQKQELNAFEHQAAVMKLLGCSDAKIRVVEKQRGTHWQAPQYYTC
jgi:hypothetical protein